MLGIPTVKRYYLYKHPTDMRKSFRGLIGLVHNELGGDVRSGDGFVFINKRRTMIKILVWDTSGFVIYYKQLASGTFEMPHIGLESQKGVELSVARLVMILEGIELKSARWRKRYRGRKRA